VDAQDDKKIEHSTAPQLKQQADALEAMIGRSA